MYPNFKNKYCSRSIVNSESYLDYLKKVQYLPSFKPPKSCILCFQNSLLKYIVDNYKTEKHKTFCDIYLLKNNSAAVAGNFGIGAPSAVIAIELLIALGIKRFILIGMAGTLQKRINAGDIIVCEKSIRDEGVSHHYLKSSKYAYPSKQITRKITNAIDKLGINYHIGASWTTDAPYRETIAEVRKYQKEGILTVEMESSALFAVSEYRKVECGAVFSVSDSLADFKWTPKFHFKNTKKSLIKLFEICLQILNS